MADWIFLERITETPKSIIEKVTKDGNIFVKKIIKNPRSLELQCLSSLPNRDYFKIHAIGNNWYITDYGVTSDEKIKNATENKLQLIYKVAVDILSDLEILHTEGVAHCDIKSDNIIFNEKHNRFYLIDYDLVVSAFTRGNIPRVSINYYRAISGSESPATIAWKLDLQCLATTIWLFIEELENVTFFKKWFIRYLKIYQKLESQPLTFPEMPCVIKQFYELLKEVEVGNYRKIKEIFENA